MIAVVAASPPCAVRGTAAGGERMIVAPGEARAGRAVENCPPARWTANEWAVFHLNGW
jgi:hypothetical protein